VLDSREYLRGRWGEVIQLALLQSFDWSVLAACDYSGPGGDRAPRLHGACEIIVPDFDAAKLGVRAWLEAKLKASTILWRKTNREQHGIDTPKLDAYRHVQTTTGAPVILGIVEEHTGEFRANTLDGLGEPRFSDNHVFPMANWDREKFRLIAELDPRRLRKLIYDGRTIRQIRSRIDANFLRRVADYIRPRQLELPLLHYDILARAGKPA